MTKTTAPETLELVIGASNEFEVVLADEAGVLHDIAGAAEASVVIRDGQGATTDILLRSTMDANLVIDIANSKLVGDAPGGLEADEMVPGEYVGQAAFLIGSEWFFTDWFTVRLIAGGAPTA